MDLVLFGLFLIACGGAAATGGGFPPGPWYQSLTKPNWVPPNWVFPVAWTSIYLLISFAGARVAGLEGSAYAMAFWAIQAAFSTLWTPIFFGLRRMKTAIIVIAVLWFSVLGATIAHWQLDFWAGLAFLPYLAWVTIASALNVAMVRLNPGVEPIHMERL